MYCCRSSWLAGWQEAFSEPASHTGLLLLTGTGIVVVNLVGCCSISVGGIIARLAMQRAEAATSQSASQPVSQPANQQQQQQHNQQQQHLATAAAAPAHTHTQLSPAAAILLLLLLLSFGGSKFAGSLWLAFGWLVGLCGPMGSELLLPTARSQFSSLAQFNSLSYTNTQQARTRRQSRLSSVRVRSVEFVGGGAALANFSL